MKRSLAALVAAAGAALLLAIPSGTAGAPASSHADYFEHYEGTQTCLSCHEDAAKAFFHSQHYQWRGETPSLVNRPGKRLGKINTINDFCTSPMASWIGPSKNEAGEIVAKGCSACHAGFGLIPAENESPEQLANIDCLICHASGYRRDLYENVDGGWSWKPILWKNQEGLDSVAKRISAPKRTMCLRCHSASGGGPNWKRGDIEYVLNDPPRVHDVHMSADGGRLECVSCHAAGGHRVLGRGVDLAANDTPGKTLSCDQASCHGLKPHGVPALDRHADAVYCTTCHIPSFARSQPTDMVRDWSQPVRDPETGKYKAYITLASDVVPVYGWFNGTTRVQLLGESIRTNAAGQVVMADPQGSRKDPKARIYPFKLHRGKLPLLDGKKWLSPIAVDEFFATGNLDEAVQRSAKTTYGLDHVTYTWVEAVRYMGIFHGVPPKEKALDCLDCHSPKGRLDWKALGYDRDPLDEPRSATPGRRTSSR